MKSLRYSAMSLICLAFAISAPASANVVLNGSFESPLMSTNAFCITFAAPFCPAIPSWTGNFYLVNGDSGGGIGGVPAPPIPDGAQYIMIQSTGHSDQSVTISQGGVYTLSWSDAGRSLFSGTETYDILFGGNVLGSFSTVPTAPWTVHSLQFSTGTGSFTFSIVGTQPFSVGDNASFFDNIQLNPLQASAGAPEPGTIVLAGAAICVLMLRRRLAPAIRANAVPPQRNLVS
jgi:hypothetical protein